MWRALAFSFTLMAVVAPGAFAQPEVRALAVRRHSHRGKLPRRRPARLVQRPERPDVRCLRGLPGDPTARDRVSLGA